MLQGLSNIPQQYYAGQEAQYKLRNQNLFQNPDNRDILDSALKSGDYSQLMTKLAQAGGASTAAQLLPLSIDLQQQSRFYQGLSGQGQGQDRPVSTGPAMSTAAASPANLGQPQPSAGQPRLSSAGMDSAGAETLQSLAAGIAGGRSVNISPAVMNAARMMGKSPDEPLSAAEEAQARRLYAVSLAGGGGSQPMGNTQVPQRNPVVAQQTMQAEDESNPNHLPPSMGEGSSAMSPRPTAASGSLAGAPAAGVQTTPNFNDRFGAAYGQQQSTPLGSLKYAEALDRQADYYYKLAATPRINAQQKDAAVKLGDVATAHAKQIRDTLQSYGNPQNNPDLKGQMARYEGASKAVGDTLGEYIKKMPEARMTINELAVIGDALKAGRGTITTGPGAEAALKIKQFLGNLGLEVSGKTEAEVIQKMNTQLASVAGREFSQRPSQLEFKIFQQNLPGILNSPRGTEILIDVLRQLTEQRLSLGRLASNKSNWDNWGDVEQRFFDDPKNQIKLPFSGNAAGGATPLPKGVRSIEVVQ